MMAEGNGNGDGTEVTTASAIPPTAHLVQQGKGGIDKSVVDSWPYAYCSAPCRSARSGLWVIQAGVHECQIHTYIRRALEIGARDAVQEQLRGDTGRGSR
jgi:hypothetical protein